MHGFDASWIFVLCWDAPHPPLHEVQDGFSSFVGMIRIHQEVQDGLHLMSVNNIPSPVLCS